MSDERYELLKTLLATGRWKVDPENGHVITKYGIASKLTRGYVKFGTVYKGKRTNFFAHHVIMMSLGFDLRGLYVNHKNGVKNDNRACNLELVTQKENIHHAIKTGLSKINGEFSHRSKLNYEEVKEIRKRCATGENQQKIAKVYGVSVSTVNRINTKKIWKEGIKDERPLAF